MKSISTHLSYFFRDAEMQRNLRSLGRYLLFLCGVIALYTVLFHYIMLQAEGREHSWITGLYWTLTVMSTLGFGDITFESDVGRLFSVVVLVSGIVMLLIVLPFAFIRYFYAPWLEEQIRNTAPRALPADTEDHMVICAHDPIVDDLIDDLEREEIPYVLIEPDPATAAQYVADGVSVMTGALDDKETYVAARVDRARLVLANSSDENNTNITLTVREVSPDVPIAAVATREASIDVLELVGATNVLPVKKWLGEQLANRVPSRRGELLPIGSYADLSIAELPVQNTPLAGRTVRETRLREQTGVSIIAVWERGLLEPARPDTRLSATSVPVVIGTDEQLARLENQVTVESQETRPALVIGGGRVGRAAIRALERKEVPVHLIELDPAKCEAIRAHCAKVFQGDASDYDLLEAAGIREASSVVLTTNDDATNVYLSSYCRRLNEGLRVISRITRERNLEAIHRAGADFVLSFACLGSAAVLSILRERQLVVMGEEADLFARAVPDALSDRTLAASGIGAKTGLTVIGIAQNGDLTTGLTAETHLPEDGELLMIGTEDQLDRFVREFE